MKLVVGNFKMNLNNHDIETYINYFKNKNYSNVVFAPSFIYLNKFVENGLITASQDVSRFEIGAYTGDISASQLKSIGVNYSIIGHSERRKYYNDSELINEKIIQLIKNDIKPILCVGESKEEREENRALEIIKKEIDNAFDAINKDDLANTTIAYEPIWSIGTGIVPTNNQIEEVIAFIKEYVKSNYSFDVRVLYGGSVNNKCIDELEKIDVLDGYLVGGCSLKYDDFDKLINSVK